MSEEQHIDDLLKQLQAALAVVTKAALDREVQLQAALTLAAKAQDTVSKQVTKIAALQAEVAFLDTRIHELRGDLAERTEVLEFYADSLTYDPQVVGGVPGGLAHSLIMEDGGESARNVLGKRINWDDSSIT